YPVRFGSGDSGWRLERPSFADVMRETRRSHVVTLGIKDRSAIMLAGHGGEAVTWFGEALGGWVTSTAFAPAPLPVVDAFVSANSVRRDFGKTWDRTLKDSRIADDQPGEAPPPGWTATFPHVLSGANNAADATYIAQWERSPFADAYVGRFAAALVDGFMLGRHDTTDVIGVSFATPDILGHAFGPRSLEQEELYAQLDRTLGTFFEHLDATVGRGEWVVALSADHGVTPIVEQLAAEGRPAGRIPTAMVTGVVEQQLTRALGEGRYVAQLVLSNDLVLMPGVIDKLRAQPKVLDKL